MKKNIIMILCTVIIICIGSYFIVNKYKSGAEKTNQDNNYAYTINAGSIGEDDLIYKDVLVTDYKKYEEIMLHYEMEVELSEADFEKYDYLSIVAENDYCGGTIDGISYKIDNKDINIVTHMQATCSPCAPLYELFFVRFDKGTIKDGYKVNMSYENVNNVECDPQASYKPVIYLYPESETYVNVKVGKPENLTTTYPKYNSGWTVLAKEDGTLIGADGRSYYALYWEGLNTSIKGMTDEGFVVKGEDTISFLEEKLSKLGLNERESNEFIMYWLPKLENNAYNYIRFASREEIDKNMPLYIEPKADTVIRILMVYKPLDTYISVKEQQITTPVRQGFTVVEWGGTNL